MQGMDKRALFLFFGLAALAFFSAILYFGPLSTAVLGQAKPLSSQPLPVANPTQLEQFSDAVEAEGPGLGFAELSNGKISLFSGNEQAIVSFHSLDSCGELPDLNCLRKMPLESELSIDSNALGPNGFKWGYKFRLPSKNFRAGLLVEAESEIVVFDRGKPSFVVDNSILDFSDFAGAGFSLSLSQPGLNTALISVSKDFLEADLNVGNWVYLDPSFV